MESKLLDDDANKSQNTQDRTTICNNTNNNQMAAEMKKISDEFNAQRAKLKDLYLQKEADCIKLSKELDTARKALDDTKNRLVIAEINREKDLEDQGRRAQEEIQTLQTLVHETCDESTRSISEFKRLSDENEHLRQQILDLKTAAVQSHHPDIPSLGPMFNHVKKIAKKLGGTESSASMNDVNLEGDMRKVNKYAQEDAEVLRSLVVPLEEEIKSLKEKLRSVHTELENSRKSDSTQTFSAPESALIGMLGPRRCLIEPEGASALVSIPCEMCKNYESKLVNSEKLLADEMQKCQNHEKSMERMREDLQKESALRRELETQWQEKREEHKDEVIKLKENLQKTATEMKEISASYAQLKETVSQDLLKITEERERVYHHLKILQSDNDMLSGKYLAHSEYLKDQTINLPQDIEALHELVLGLHENLILAKVGQEYGEAKYKNFADEANLLRDQMQAHERDRIYIEKELQLRIGGLEEKLRTQQDHFQKLVQNRDELKRRDAELKKQNSDLRMQLIELTEAKEKQDKTVRELRIKETVLQQELGNSEAVQQDFVRLSQSLQIQLEKIRSADTQVRWQDEDDVNNCGNCKKEFTVTRRKQHCRHCGTIYCPNCLTKTVKSGAKQRLAHVCDVCHFLLVQNTPPYFSHAPPQSP